MEQRDFFISYTQSDEATAEWAARMLEAHGYTVWYQARDSLPGVNFVLWISKAMDHAKNFIFIWSKAYSESRHCMGELTSGYNAWASNEIDLLIPVRLEDIPLYRLYRQFGRVDLFGVDEMQQEQRLLRSVEHVDKKWLSADLYDGEKSAEELNQRGETHYNGHGVPQDFSKARQYWEQAAIKGNADALYNLGILYEFGRGVMQDYVKALQYYEQAAKAGNAKALNNLGWLYRNGYGVTQDYAKARQYYEQSAAKGNARALNNLGWLYENGYGIPKNIHKALGYYQQAVDMGNKRATGNLDRVRKELGL